MRSFGKSDILFLIFFADMTVLMLYGMSEILSYTYIHGGMVASSITLKNMFVYFYYPPKNILSSFLPASPLQDREPLLFFPHLVDLQK